MMDRRAFIGGAAFVVMAPPHECQALPSPLPDARASRTIVVIEGWGPSAKDEIANQVSIRINSGWRASWR
jgi:hypothetical protein